LLNDVGAPIGAGSKGGHANPQSRYPPDLCFTRSTELPASGLTTIAKRLPLAASSDLVGC
jgi:hypothetical protein